MVTLSVSNIKGGVAKTTTAATLAAGLHVRGKKVLMIDTDPQTNLTMCFTDEPGDDDPTLYNLYAKGTSIKDLKMEIKPGLDLVPGDFMLSRADTEFGGVGMRPLMHLEKAIKEEKDNYDFVIIDTPPNLGILSLNAFWTSNYIVTPMATDSFSFKAIRLLQQTIDEVSESTKRNIPVAGILITRYMDRTNVAKATENSIQTAANTLNTKVFNSRIRQAVVVQESQLVKQDLFEYAPTHAVTQDYASFIDELLTRIGG